MTAGFKSSRALVLAGFMLAVGATLVAQSSPQTTPADKTQAGSTPASQTPASSTQANTPPASTPTALPAPGTTPVGGDTQATPAEKPVPGTTPAGGDTPAAPSAKPAPGTTPVGGDTAAAAVNPEKVVEPGSQKINVKPGSIDDVNAVGNRDIGARGMGNWYSVDSEIKMGKMYASEIEKSTKFITDPVVVEYVNRVGQNIVKNSDCKVPFTIKVIEIGRAHV